MEEKLVSVIVRTHSRPAVLRETLESIRRQTYKNIEVVVSEDGKDTAGNMIKTEFSDMNIHYMASGVHIGRCAAANRALEASKGEYICFLDDDDLFFENHVETLVNALNSTDMLAAYTIAYESAIKVESYEPYVYKEVKRHVEFKQPYCRLLLYYNNLFPIQCVMFHRSLYEKAGGMDESLEVLEDWDMWVRYSQYTDYFFVNKITSLYRVPAGKKEKERHSILEGAYEAQIKMYGKYKMTLTPEQINHDMKYILTDYTESRIKKFLKKIRDYIRRKGQS